MRPKFCPACGKETKKLFGNVCGTCLRRHRLVEIPKKIKIRVCSSCGNVVDYDKELDGEILEKIVKKNMKVNGTLKEVEIKMKEKMAEINVTGLLDGKLKVREKLETLLETKKRLCENCGKIRGGYYEAVIQLRSGDRKKLEKTIRTTEFFAEKRGHVTKIEHRKEGVDIYLTPKKSVNYILKNIPGKMEVKKSYTLVTRKGGKDLYRNTVLVRL